MEKIPTKDKFILDDDDNPVPCYDLLEWGMWMEENRPYLRLSKTMIQAYPKIYVSTVFLGLNHSYCFDVPPIKPVLWESMVFGGAMHHEQERYSSKEEAIAGHLRLVDEVRAVL